MEICGKVTRPQSLESHKEADICLALVSNVEIVWVVRDLRIQNSI